MAAVRVSLILASLLGLLVLAAPAPALAQGGARPPALSAEAVLLLDLEGRVVYAKNAEAERAPASLVKLMTLYLAFEDLRAGRVELDESVRVSRRAALTPRYRMGLRAGEMVPLRVLMEGVAIASANDAATAIAEHLAADEPSFVTRMNAMAEALELTATRFANPHGLPDPGQYSNARDLGELAARLLHDHPEARAMLGARSFAHNGRVLRREIPLFSAPAGVETVKTGFTHEAGYNLAVSAWRGGLEFVMIVLGARSRVQSFLDARRLLHFGYVETGLEAAAPPPRPAPPTVRARRATAVPAP